MGLFRSAVREYRDQGLSGLNDPSNPLYQTLSGWVDGIGGISRIANLPPVNDDSATRITAVYRAVSIISDTVGILNFQLFERRADGSRANLGKGFKDLQWIESSPNPEVTPSFFWSTSVGHCVLDGNAYWFLMKDRLGRPRELWPIAPRRVSVGRDPDTKRKFYVVDGNKDVPFADYRPDGTGEIVHIPAFSQDGLKGVSKIRQARLAFQLAMAAEEYGARIFADGSVPGGILSTDADLDENQARKLKARWEQYHRGLANAHRVAILDNGAKWQKTSLAPEEAQFLQTRAFSVQEIARLFGIAPHLLADVSGSTSWGKGIEEQNRNTVTYTLSPYTTRFQEAISLRVLSAYPGVFGRFDLNELLRGDVLKRYQGYAFGRQWGFLSINDIRRLEDQAPVDGGDEYMMPMNMQNVAASNGDPAQILAPEKDVNGED